MSKKMARKQLDFVLSQQFKCPKCNSVGAHVERVAMAGTGISRFMEIQPFTYALVSCLNCGFTESYNLKILEGQDNLGQILDVLFMD
jgi:predicted nucleic-acid-binding Zn-ribbon protein